MNEYALFINGTFNVIKWMSELPPDIPHKNVEWFPVVREYGTPGQGVENDIYYIRTQDPATVIPEFITATQARLVLNSIDKLTTVNELVAAASEEVKIYWEYSVEIHRDNPILNTMAEQLGLTPEQVDALFVQAKAL